MKRACIAAMLALAAGVAAAAEGATAAPTGAVAMKLGLREAVALGLRHNPALRVERLNPSLRSTYEAEAQSVFDPALRAEASGGEQEKEELFYGTLPTNSTLRRFDATAAVEKLFPAGARLGIEGGSSLYDSSLASSALAETRLGLSVTQPLLRGRGADVNLVQVRQARIDAQISAFELQGFVESLVAGIEEAYWDLLLARRQAEIFEESVALAERQLAENRERVRHGALPEIELAASEAEVASQREGSIAARGAAETARLRLLRALGPPPEAGWGAEIEPADAPETAAGADPAIEARAGAALRNRPDLRQARLSLERGELEVVRTLNGLLPRLDLFARLGRTGYADAIGESASDVPTDGYDASAGLRLEFPFRNRQAEAQHRRAGIGVAQAREAVRNLEALAEFEVRSAAVDLGRAREQTVAAEATVRLREATLRAETGKLDAGKSTALWVARAQRDLLEARLRETEARAACARAVVRLERADASLLPRRGIAVEAGEAP